MIIPKHGLLVAARLKRSVTGIERVIISRTDGIALYDDVPLAARDGAAALTAATVGLAATATSSFALGAARLAVLEGEAGSLVIAPVDAGHLLAVVLGADVPVGDAVREVVQRESEWLRSMSGMARVAS
ncbi:roadblock/LC7 domain-containing protein [Demequina flava]|uniref:roadblock/LC7 domain-containing protein n=1 Tax=Demequina flava TaxID=1095025 RepID=UPI0007831ED7|nr:roadblock/LC7 domain-containing protein [Demequina flava]